MPLPLWLACSLLLAPEPDLVWTTPSADHHGSMPLGNGEIGVNAWIEPSGDLCFYLGRTDSWDEQGRLLKIGKLRLSLSGTSASTADEFRWSLTAGEGRLWASWGLADQQVAVALWVDANRPVIVAQAWTTAQTQATLTAEPWRTEPTVLGSVEVSDIFRDRPEPTTVTPDTFIAERPCGIGWYHHNAESVGLDVLAEVQGTAGFAREDPLRDRVSGALASSPRGLRLDPRRLVSTTGREHRFEIVALTVHPSSPVDWLAAAEQALAEARAVPLERRWASHAAWWAEWDQRSWLRVWDNGRAVGAGGAGVIPANEHPLRLGQDNLGGSPLRGRLGRATWRDGTATDAEIAALAAARAEGPVTLGPQPDTQGFVGNGGFVAEAWVFLDESVPSSQRIFDKLTAGVNNGFLLDAYPDLGLRAIVGERVVQIPDALSVGVWQHIAAVVSPSGEVTLYRDGQRLAGGGDGYGTWVGDGDDAEVVSRAYRLQRFVRTCAGRGEFPIKFNGSIFTVPHAGAPGDADYRRWGPGYWWQNTRLPYYAMLANGDEEQMASLVRMYAVDMLPLLKYRTRAHLNQDGAYLNECVYFWGDIFSESYGWTPAAEREDKLQASRWHKWEWVAAPELSGLLLDYYDHTGNRDWLREVALPAVYEFVLFFDQRYALDETGHYFMHPAQALETWWDCDNPMPEVAGLHAITSRLLGLPAGLLTAEERAFYQQVAARVPPPPTHLVNGEPALAPAARYAQKSNIENPELYAVWPFRLYSFDRPNPELAIRAYEARGDRGHGGWRHDSVFAAHLGLTDEARDSLVIRARSKAATERFPVFWGPNYDWTPDQCHGGVLELTLQKMLLQTDGDRIWLLPAWPADWDADFRLHAPRRTVLEGQVRGGRLTTLTVTPNSRASDVLVVGASER